MFAIIILIFQWEVFNAKKPQPGVNHPDDEAAYEYAKATIGDYVLKTDENYRVPPHLKQTTTNKFRELLNCQQEVDIYLYLQIIRLN